MMRQINKQNFESWKNEPVNRTRERKEHNRRNCHGVMEMLICSAHVRLQKEGERQGSAI
jgi:hypothetical protein